MTVLFTDLKGFTTFSETVDPEVLGRVIGRYLDAMTSVVFQHGGTLDKFIGDAVMAFWNAPLDEPEHALRACQAALDMQATLERLNDEWQSQGLPRQYMRIGINTGGVVAGSLGSADRMKYTTLGDTVNTASRLESFDKSLYLPHLETSPCRILIADSTLRYLNDLFETQQVGELTLKGKEERISAHCVLRRKAEAKERRKR